MAIVLLLLWQRKIHTPELLLLLLLLLETEVDIVPHYTAAEVALCCRNLQLLLLQE